MNAVAVIPCRMGSSRFPGKPMAKISGMPMVGHIYKRTKLAKQVDKVVVATCDQEIFDYVESIGGTAIMTADTHKRATERVGEAIDKLEQAGGKFAVIIMVQGDEPMIHPDTVDQMIQPFLDDKTVQIVNLTNEITDQSEYNNPDIVKLNYDQAGKVVWFWRQPSPYWADKVTELPIKIQTGIIAFTRQALFDFNNLAPTPFEKANSVDMCRFLENNFPIYITNSEKRLFSVDTPADRDAVEAKLADDKLAKSYLC